MSVYDDTYNLRYANSTLKNRAIVACAKAATDVLNEDVGTDNHANRVVWARATFSDAKSAASAMLWGLVANATVRSAFLADPSGATVEDSVVQNAVNGLIDQFATG